MESVIIAQITQNINITIVVLLLIIGAVFKHWITFVPNKYIPVILCGLGIVLTIIFHLPIANGALVISYLIEGIASGIAATIVHSKGKDIIADLFDKERVINDVEEEVDKVVKDQLDKLASIDFSDVDAAIAEEMGESVNDQEPVPGVDDMVDISDAFKVE